MPRKIFDKLMQKNEQQKKDVAKLIEKEESKPEQPDYTGASVMFSEAITAIQNPDIPDGLSIR